MKFVVMKGTNPTEFERYDKEFACGHLLCDVNSKRKLDMMTKLHYKVCKTCGDKYKNRGVLEVSNEEISNRGGHIRSKYYRG